jgi:molybdate transport system regulatory protein
MSYRAAWGKIRATEAALGEKIIRRSGHRREGHELTEFGTQLKRRFNQWFDAVEAHALELAGQLFPWPVRCFQDPLRTRQTDPEREHTPAMP